MLFGGFINLVWQYFLFKQLDNPIPAFIIAIMIQGTLGLQLLGNHYTRPWVDITDQKYVSFPERQVEVNINYKNSRWFDWFFGGLNFHYEHHMFPCMPRGQLRLIAFDIKALCKKHDVSYEYVWFHEALWKMALHLDEVGKKYTEDQKTRRPPRFKLY